MTKVKKSSLPLLSMMFLFILASCTSSVDILFGDYREKTSLNSIVRIAQSKDDANIVIYNNYESEKTTPSLTFKSKPTSQEKVGDNILYTFDSIKQSEPSIELAVATKASSGINKGQILSFTINRVTYDLSLDKK